MRKIDRFIVRGLLGRGGMGAVWRVLDPDSGRILALKMLAPRAELLDLAGPDALRREFLREAELMAGLRHPNIATVFSPGEHLGQPYYLMDFHCDNLGLTIGETYRVEAPSRLLPIEQACGYILQTVDGLAALHEIGIIHRDIKPFNLLITPDDTIRIIDFGLSRNRNELPLRLGSAAVGSPYYAAPEQEVDPDSADARADLYAVGVTLCRLLCGHLPHYEDGDGPACVRPSSLNPDLNHDWDAFLARACALKPENRFATARAMSQELRQLLVDWRSRVSAICAAPDLTAPEPAVPPADRPRSAPLKCGQATARSVFNLDILWRPDVRPVHNLEVASRVIRDIDTGLTWQRAASPEPLPRPLADDYLDSLNASGFGGHSDWRLPTIAELASIMRRPPHLGDYCTEPAFEQGQRRFWSGDRKSYAASWFADAASGFVGWADHDCELGVRAVRG